ncbi:MAG: FtsX-like permease family protein [Vicinamibacteria bacterium]|nr:FtsX-like permease family protein [Vicinamibacteria bacterium]
MRVSALNRKLLRDLWGMKGQALAIASVVAAGVTMFVMYQSNFDSLYRSQRIFYEQQRFADVFASLKRAPLRLERRIAEIPGVSSVYTRVVADVVLDIPGLPEPARGRLVSLPARSRPLLNDIHLRSGRWPDPFRDNELLAGEAFFTAHRYKPGATISAIINGRRRVLTIVGSALSPEYVYSMPPGEMIPDDRRYGVFWMNRAALASAFDMEGGFNDVTLRLMPGASIEDVMARLDRLLEPYGGFGAIPRALQFSHWSLESELKQLRDFGFLIPLIFLGVAAFILNTAMTRALALQRQQIAALKALGYSNGELAWHYIKWALFIASIGAVAGVLAGAWLGRSMIVIYNQYFRFPVLDFRLSIGVTVIAVLQSLLIAALGAFSAVRRAVRIPPAEAMQPEPPARYSVSFSERLAFGRRLSNITRMVLRNVERHPARSSASIIGIALSVAILVMGFSMVDVMDILKQYLFSYIQRQNVTVTFAEPASSRALHEMRSLPGVLHVEPMRAVPARLRHGHRHRNVSVVGMRAAPRLNRVVDRSGRAVSLPPEGLVISRKLGEVLDIAAGDRVLLEVLEGSRPARFVNVSTLVDDFLGLSAFMEQDALHRLMREAGTLSGVYLQVQDSGASAISARLKRTPAVAGVSVTAAALRSFEDVMAQNMDVMILINVLFAGVIALGVVYNAARISLSERERELASLRVLGFTRGEISLVLLGELAMLTFLSLPAGVALGYGFTLAIMSSIESEVYRFPLIITPQAMARSALVVLIAAAISGLFVRRKLDRLDLVAVLKTRE